MTTLEPLLSVTGLHAGYGPVEVLRGVDLQVGNGEIVALLGSNGAGKTTLNNTMSGIYPARQGRIVFDGVDLTNQHYSAVVKAGLIQVPEGRKIFPNLNVLENLELGSFTRARVNRQHNLQKVFEIFPRLKERLTQLAGTMSGGEQQMLAIGRGLMAEPKLLLLEQNVAQSLALAKRAYVMENGVIRFHGNADELMQSDEIRRAYLGL
jgi:branched-chain amino acid transport system ATP-binding protein